LAFAKKNLDKIKNGTTAYKSLINNAEKALEEEIIPVTEKTKVAASGNVHDYLSMGPYWWPDPTKPNGLPYIRKDGQRNPELKELDRNKLDRLSKTVRYLSYAYYFSEKEKYAEKAVDNLKIWFLNPKTKMNPNLNYAQMIFGRDNNNGRAEGIIDTYCFVELLDCIQMLSSSKYMRTADYNNLKQWFSDFLDWMLTSKIGNEESAATNNHGTSFDVQATAVALFTGRIDVADSFINEFAQQRIFAKIEPDGKQPRELERTMALHYSIFNISHAMDLCVLADKRNVDIYSQTSEDGRFIGKAVEFIGQYLGKPQSAFPYQQINDWDENQIKLCWLLRRTTAFQPNADYDVLFNKYCTASNSDLNWLLFAK
jgi:hypothetical protein